MATSIINTLVKNTTFSGTTDNAGNVKIFTGSTKKIVGLRNKLAGKYPFAIPYVIAGGDTYLKVMDYGTSVPTNWTSKDVSFEVWYIGGGKHLVAPCNVAQVAA